MRERTRVEPDEWVLFKKYRNGAFYDQANCKVYSKAEEIRDVVTPNYRSRVARGEVINNDCVYLKDEQVDEGGGNYTATSTDGLTVYTTDTGPITQYESNLNKHKFWSNGSVSVDVDGLTRDAKLSALADIDPSVYSFGEDVVELRKTLQFIRKPMASMLDIARKFRKSVRNLNPRTVEDVAKAISKTYLEYRFALTPLVRSVSDAADAALNWDEFQRYRPLRLTARGREKQSSSEDGYHQHNFSATAFDVFRRQVTLDVEVRAGILYEVLNPIRNTPALLGLRARDIPETLWAVMPYSFMVDRVVNITDAVRALTNLADPSVKILAAWHTRKTDLHRSLTFVSETVPGYDIVINPSIWRLQSFEYSREVWKPTVIDAVPRATPKGLVRDATAIADLGTLILSAFRFTRSYK